MGNVIWAGSNLSGNKTFAAQAADPGAYFQWGYNIAYPCYGNPYLSTTYPGSGLPEWTSARDPCPAPWHVPTKAEFEALLLKRVNTQSYHGSDYTVPVVLSGQTVPINIGVTAFTGDNGDVLTLPHNGMRQNYGNGEITLEVLAAGPEPAYWSKGPSCYMWNGGHVFDTHGAEGMAVRCVRDAMPRPPPHTRGPVL